MRIRRLVQATSIAGVALFMMAASASATTITFNTNAAGTQFVSSGTLTLLNTTGVAASLKFTPDANIAAGLPSNVNLGDFLLVCASCSLQAQGAGSFFNPFTFDLVVTDVTDGATGTFVGTSTGGSVYSDVSALTITWAPLQLGPGGNFKQTLFQTSSFTGIPAPNSGTPPGDVTVQGFVNSTAVPEPATLSLIGGSLLGLGLWRRKKVSRS